MGYTVKGPFRYCEMSPMIYRNKREYEQTVKNLETVLQEGAQRVKQQPKPSDVYNDKTD